jgi:hypothetical protein
MSKPEAVSPPAATKTRSPKRSQEQIETDLKAQLARIAAKKKIDEWAASTAATITTQALTMLGDKATDGVHALGKLLIAPK